MEDNKVIYAYSIKNATYIDGVKIWDRRWWKNILCKINWFFHFRKRKMHRKYEKACTDFNEFKKYCKIK